MPQEYVTRDEFNGAMHRMDGRVSQIEQHTTAIRVSAETQADTVNKMYAILYGDKQDGVLFSVANLKTKMGIIQWLTIVTVTPVITLGISKLFTG
jgi:aspartate carbamoyltransferase catalytic subunit